MAMEQKRLDVLMVDRGLASSRENAKRLIESGKVSVDGKPVTKPSKTFLDSVTICAEEEKYVSRGAYKLEKAVSTFGVQVEGRCFMDCGASTGGFTDFLLQHGASNVWAVDVGSNQLADKLRKNCRVTSIENTNIRYMESAEWMSRINGVVMDLSFISLTLIFPRLFELLPDDAEYIALVKPQFEAGREALNKHGIVRSAAAHIAVLRKISKFVSESGYNIHGLTASPIKGGDGNSEYLIYFSKRDNAQPVYADGLIRKAVESALGENNRKE